MSTALESRRLKPVRCAFIGVRAALRAPGYIAGDLGAVLAAPVPAGSALGERAQQSARWARRGVRVLAALPGGRWRNTCLFRSVAECLALREHGVAARLRLGVRGADSGIDAHAWVEVDGAGDSGEAFTPIEPGGAPASPCTDPGARDARRRAAGR